MLAFDGLTTLHCLMENGCSEYMLDNPLSKSVLHVIEEEAVCVCPGGPLTLVRLV